MSIAVGIVGAGVIGRLLALKGAAMGWKVTLFERGDDSGKTACSTVAPAMLAPYCELDVSEKTIADLGAASLKLWPEILRTFELPVFFQQAGTLVVAHPYDLDELPRFKRNVVGKAGAGVVSDVETTELASLEPQLDRRFLKGLYFPAEGQIDSRGLMAAMRDGLRRHAVDCRFGHEAQVLAPHEIRCMNDVMRFDIVLDCRGYGAAANIPDLRAVRGELIHVEAPDVHLNRPVRLLHPRWPLYVVPRPAGRYVIGATTVESEDSSPISVRSTLELLSAAYALNAGFSEARIIETVVGLRPAFPDNQPRIQHQPGLIRVNGLYRHGFLCAPKITDFVCDLVATEKPQAEFAGLFQQVA